MTEPSEAQAKPIDHRAEALKAVKMTEAHIGFPDPGPEVPATAIIGLVHAVLHLAEKIGGEA